jgi:MOSC domain-containing protein YiiM
MPRTPCAKLAGKHGEPRLAKWVADANATGFYLRVLEEGRVAAGDPFTLVQAHPERISIASVVDIIFDRSHDEALIARLLQMPEFGDSIRPWFAKRLEKLSGQAQ